MNLLRVFLAFTMLLCLSGCFDKRRSAERAIQEIGVQSLRKDAAQLYKDVFAPAAPEFLNVGDSLWPETFRRLGAQQVGAYPDGFSLLLVKRGATESGLYIVPLHMEKVPPETAHARFQRIVDGIYWYDFTR